MVIKGIGHLFQTLELPMSGVIRIVDLINKMLEKNMIRPVNKPQITNITTIASAINMSVAFEEKQAA